MRGLAWRAALLILPWLLLALELPAETLVAWNNLGMHCVDADFAVFSLLPPFNTIHAQLIDKSGKLVRDPAGWVVTYQAIEDPSGSTNSTSVGKTNFWQFAEALFGLKLPPDMGLMGVRLPGKTNQPQRLRFDFAHNWFVAEGIPVVPYDDQGRQNPYPLYLLVATDRTGAVRASVTVVAPVSDEMDCRACHASGSSPAAQPLEGWVYDSDSQRDMRWNILRLHDDREGANPRFQVSLAEAGYDARGLYATARSGRPILCARCHASEALPGSGLAGISPLTQAVHRRMAWAQDPATLQPLAASDNRAACYRCHPGRATRCLRGAMGSAVAPDGSRAIECQNCHGGMLAVAEPTRRGWLDEPNCQSCHTGTAVRHRGRLRFTDVFDVDGKPRLPADDTFATNADTPIAGTSLYRFSKGHGRLACEACHGPTHAEYPSTEENDNLQSLALQGHVGPLAECSTCHQRVPLDPSGGPHGLHPLGQVWVDAHGEATERTGVAGCQRCHGTDYRGGVLSRVLGERQLYTKYGAKTLWRGFQVSCYLCHDGPKSEERARNRPPVVLNLVLETQRGRATQGRISASDADGDTLTLRVVRQPMHGTAVATGSTLRYIPDPEYSGEDSFTFAAWDGQSESNLAVALVRVVDPQCIGDCNGDGSVTIEELVVQARIALEELPPPVCPSADYDGNGQVTIEEIVQSVRSALRECALPTPNVLLLQ